MSSITPEKQRLSGFQSEKGFTVWHFDPNFAAVIIDLLIKCAPDRFVETGTYRAETIRWIANRFPALPIFSTEINPNFYAKSVKACRLYGTISISNMSSPDFLKDMYGRLSSGLSVFWLDAHWGDYLPLRDECKIISSLDRYVIIIDDFETRNPKFDGDFHETDGGVTSRRNFNVNLEYVSDLLGRRCLVPNYHPIKVSPTYKFVQRYVNGLTPFRMVKGYKGYGIFVKGVAYDPPHFLKEETLE